MYAVIATGGKQYRVNEGSILRIEKLEAEAGANIEFDQVLLVADGDKIQIGALSLQAARSPQPCKAKVKAAKCRSSSFAGANTTCARATTGRNTLKSKLPASSAAEPRYDQF